MPHAIRFHKTGGPEVLQWDEVAVGDPGPNEARIRLKAVGLNYIDTYRRGGLYPLPLPSAIGREGAGVIEMAMLMDRMRLMRDSAYAQAVVPRLTKLLEVLRTHGLAAMSGPVETLIRDCG